MPTEVYWAAGPPALVAAFLLLLTTWGSRKMARAPAMPWRDHLGPALSVAAGYAIGHQGVAGWNWPRAEHSVVWGAGAALGLAMLSPAAHGLVPGRRRVVLEFLRAAVCFSSAACTLRGTEISGWNLGLAILVYASWAVLASLPSEESTWLVASAWLISTLGLSVTLLNSGSLKLALLAGALASALGGVSVIAFLRGRQVSGIEGVVAIVFGALLLNGYWFAELGWPPGTLLLASLLASRLSGWKRLVAALLLAGAAAAVSWSPPAE